MSLTRGIRRNLLLGLSLLLVSVLGSLLLNAHKASALIAPSNTTIDGQGPTIGSGDVYPNGPQNSPWFAVGTGQYNGPFSYAKVYIQSNSTLTIQQAPCNSDVGAPDVQYMIAPLKPDESGTGPGTVTFVTKGPNQCGGSYNVALNGGQNSSIPGHGAWKVFYVLVWQFNSAPGDNERSFRFIVNNGGVVGVSRPVYCSINGGSCDPNVASSYFGVYERTLFGGNWNYEFQFAPRCNEAASNVSTKIQLYDMDPNVYPQPNLAVDLRRDSRSNPGYSWSSLGGYPKTFGFFQSGSGKFDYLNFTANVANRYQVWFQDIDWHNTIQIYSPYDQFDAMQSVNCNAISVSCTATANPALVAVNTGSTIKVVLKNSASSIQKIPSTYQLRQYSPSGGAQTVGGGGIDPGGSQTFTYNIAARASPQVIIFRYALFDGSGAGASVVGNQPLCSGTITWKSNPPGPGQPYGTITPACGDTNMMVHTVAKDYFDTTASPGYWTTAPPDGTSPDSNFYWNNNPPPKSNPQPPGVGSPGAVQVWIPGGPATYYWYGDVRTNENPATVVPYYVEFDDADTGAVVGTSPVATATANGGNATFSADTFNTLGPFLWPHNNYVAKLFAEVTGTFQKNGPYGNWTLLDAGALDQCLHASINTACVGPSADGGPVEPGDNYTFTYQVQLTNNTKKTFSMSDPNGYNFQVWTSGGITYLGGQPGSAGSLGGPGTSNITINVPARVDYAGQFGVIFRFQGSQLALDDWTGSCGVPGGPGTPGSDTPSTRPYFQVWNTDTSAGGAFRDISDNCPNSSDPPYVSPVLSGDTNSGGIRAFANKSAGRGSLTDFGALALGSIAGSPGGPIGFYSGSGVMFANTVGSQPPGGYLNSNSDAHCVPDFFTNTRITPSPPAFPGWGASSGQYTLSPGSLGGGSISQNQQLTVYVDGDLTITGNINFPNKFDPKNQNTIPYLAIIVRGNITLTSNVTHLDGLYVAQPTTTGGGGDFSTCSDTCNSQLVIDGAVIAQKVDLLRSHGTLGPVDNDTNGLGYNPAEIINYVPSMVIGSPMFQGQSGNLETIFSLPPVF